MPFDRYMHFSKTHAWSMSKIRKNTFQETGLELDSGLLPKIVMMMDKNDHVYFFFIQQDTFHTCAE